MSTPKRKNASEIAEEMFELLKPAIRSDGSCDIDALEECLWKIRDQQYRRGYEAGFERSQRRQGEGDSDGALFKV